MFIGRTKGVLLKMDPSAIKFAQGHPGSLAILNKCSKRDDFSLILAYLEGTETFGPKIWIMFKNECKEDYEVFFKKCLPKYHLKTSIKSSINGIGYIDHVFWSKENKCWIYEYSYGLGGASDGYIKESNIKLNK